MHARGVAQLAARHVRDVEVGSSSLLTPTIVACKSFAGNYFLCRHIVCLDEYRECTPKISGETVRVSPLCIYG